MRYKIVYDKPGRLRMRCGAGVFTKKQENSLTELLTGIDGISSIEVSSVNGGILAYYTGSARKILLETIRGLDPTALKEEELEGIRLIDEEFKRDLYSEIKKRVLTSCLYPHLSDILLQL